MRNVTVTKNTMAVGYQKGLIIVCLSLFMILGGLLRLHNLGTFSLVSDEGNQALQIEGIANVGYPLMPSGLIDSVSLLFAYSQYLASVIFGLNEFSIRLSGVLFNVLAIPIIYVLVRSLLDKNTALLAAFLLAFSVWEIELSRYGRMYTLFQLFFLLSIFCFYKGFILGINGYRMSVPFIFIVTFTIHAIGLSTLVLFLFPFILEGYDVVKKRILCLYGFLSFGGMFAYAALNARVRFSMLSPTRDVGKSSDSLFSSVDVLEWTFQKIQSTVLFPPSGLLKHLYGHAPIILVVLGLLVVVLIYFCWSVPRYNFASLTKLLGCSLIIVSSAVYQFTLAVFGLYYYVLAFCRDAYVLRSRHLRFLVTSVLGFFTFWLLYAYYYKVVGGAVLHYDYLYRFPRVYDYWIRWYVIEYPLMLVITAFGVVWLWRESITDKPNVGKMFLLFSVPAFIVFPSFFYYPWYQFRYTFHLHPLILTVFSFAIVRLTTMFMMCVGSRWHGGEEKKSGIQNMFVGIVVLVLAVGLSQDSNPKDLFEIGERTYTTTKNPIKSSVNWMPYSTYVQDYQSTANFVKNRLKLNDHVLVLGSPHAASIYYYYMRKTDYVLFDTVAQGKATIQGNRHYLTGSEILTNASDLKRVFEGKNPCGTIWIMADHYMRTSGFYAVEIRMLLDEYAAEPTFMGRDNKTFVYEVDSCAFSNPA